METSQMRTGVSIIYVPALPEISLPVGTWLRRMRTRPSLRELDARALADIGLSEAERQRECARWFWQA